MPDRVPSAPSAGHLERVSADAPMTRRDYLRILVTISGGLVAGSVAVAVGVFPRRTGSGPAIRVAAKIAPGEAVVFAYPGPDDRAMAIRLRDETLVAYSSICTHLSCAVVWLPQESGLLCPCHEGRFDPLDGSVVAGPPPRPLPVIELEERRDGIYAVGASIR